MRKVILSFTLLGSNFIGECQFINTSVCVGNPITTVTLDPAKTPDATLSGGNLTATRTANGGTYSTTGHTTGKYYYELVFNTLQFDGFTSLNYGGTYLQYNYANVFSSDCNSSTIYLYSNGSGAGSISGNYGNNGDVIGICVDLTDQKWFMFNNAGTLLNSANLTTLAGGISMSTGGSVVYAGGYLYSSGSSITARFLSTSWTNPGKSTAISAGYSQW